MGTALLVGTSVCLSVRLSSVCRGDLCDLSAHLTGLLDTPALLWRQRRLWVRIPPPQEREQADQAAQPDH